MTKGQRRAGTQTLHISSSPISLCTSQDPLGRVGGERRRKRRSERGGGEAEVRLRETKNKKTKRGGRMRELSTPSFTHRNCFSLLGGKWKEKKNKWQRGDKVNKKMACKISRRYSAREEESSLWSFLISSNLTLHVPKPHFQGLICHMVFPVWMIY